MRLEPFADHERILAGARRDLDSLLRGPALPRDLLGLVVASFGELTASDLEELTGVPAYELRRVLEGADGRSFTSRPVADRAGRAYFLAHDLLQVEALDEFGPLQLSGYRDRLLGWAAGYGTAGWPETTPAYLLTAYPQMLDAVGDAGRLTGLVRDQARRERLAEHTGGDHAALMEMDSCRRLLLSVADPDLAGLAFWALHHDHLELRNTHVPSELPAVLYRLGHHRRAESLARSLPDPFSSAAALGRLARETARVGDMDAARAFIQHIPLTDPPTARPPGLRAWNTVRVAADMIARGDIAGGRLFVTDLSDPASRAECLDDLIDQAVRVADPEILEDLVATVADPDDRRSHLFEVTRRAVDMGHDRGPDLLRQAWPETGALTDSSDRASHRSNLFEAALALGVPVAGMLDDLESDIAELQAEEEREGGERRSSGFFRADHYRADLVKHALRAGDRTRAERVLADITDSYDRKAAVENMAWVNAYAGEPVDRETAEGYDRPRLIATALLGASAGGHRERILELAALLESASESYSSIDDLKHVVRAVARAGDLDLALAVAETCSLHEPPDYVLVAVAQEMITQGEWRRAADLVAPRIGAEEFGSHILLDLIGPFVDACGVSATADFISTLRVPAERAAGYTRLAEMALASGDPAAAERFARDAEQAARTLEKSSLHVRAVLELADMLAHRGDRDRYLAVIRALGTAGHAKQVLDAIVAAPIELPEAMTAEIIAAAAAEPARHISSTDALFGASQTRDREELMRSVVKVRAGRDTAAAARDALAETDPQVRLHALAEVAPCLPTAELVALGTPAVATEAVAEIMDGRARQTPMGDANSNNMVSGESGVPMEAFKNVATVLAAAEGTGAVIAYLTTFADSSWCDEARTELARHLVKSRDLNEAVRQAAPIMNRTLQAWALGDIVNGFLERSDFARAVEQAAAMRDQIIQGTTFTRIVDVALKAGEAQRASRLAGLIPFEPQRIEALAASAIALAPTAPDEARPLLEKAEEIAEAAAGSGAHFWYIGPMAEVATGWLHVGDMDQAMRLVRSGRAEPRPAHVMAGGPQVASVIADLLGERTRNHGFGDRHIEWQLTAFAEAIAEQGLRDRAEQLITGSLRDSWTDESLLHWLAGSAARRGDLEAAAQAVQRAGSAPGRARTLLAIAKAVPDVQGRWYLASAEATDIWTALMPLLDQQPGLATAVTDEYLALWGEGRALTRG